MSPAKALYLTPQFKIPADLGVIKVGILIFHLSFVFEVGILNNDFGARFRQIASDHKVSFFKRARNPAISFLKLPATPSNFSTR